MKTVSASEFKKSFGVFKEMAQREPVAVTSNGRECVVLISATEFAALQELKKKFAHSGEVNEAFEKALAEVSDKHKDVFTP